MSESRPTTDAERHLEHDAAEFEERLHHLEDDLENAERKAHERRADTDAGAAVAGDASDLGPGAGFGQDPEGAVDGDTDRDRG